MTETTEKFPDIAQLSYEAARNELAPVVKQLESAEAPLEDTLALWERGEALALRCQSVLDSAQAKLAAAQQVPQ